jgi:hypothetical protein
VLVSKCYNLEKLLNIEKKSFKSKQKIREEFGHTFGIGGKHD